MSWRNDRVLASVFKDVYDGIPAMTSSDISPPSDTSDAFTVCRQCRPDPLSERSESATLRNHELHWIARARVLNQAALKLLSSTNANGDGYWLDIDGIDVPFSNSADDAVVVSSCLAKLQLDSIHSWRGLCNAVST